MLLKIATNLINRVMDQENFSRLSTQEISALLHKDGVYLAKREWKGAKVLLYHLENHFVEIYYIRYRNTIDKIVFSKDSSILDPYLPDIKIDLSMLHKK